VRAGANRDIPVVVSDGDSARYQGSIRDLRMKESGRFAPIWVVPQDMMLLSLVWDRSFFVFYAAPWENIM